MAVEPDVIVGCEIDEGAAVDHRLGAGDPLVHAKERIGDAEKIRGFADHADFAKPFQLRRRRGGRRCRHSPGRSGAATRGDRAGGVEESFSISSALACADRPNRFRRGSIGYSAATDFGSIIADVVCASLRGKGQLVHTLVTRDQRDQLAVLRPSRDRCGEPRCNRCHARSLGERHQRQIDPQPALREPGEARPPSTNPFPFPKADEAGRSRSPAAARSSPLPRRRRS